MHLINKAILKWAKICLIPIILFAVSFNFFGCNSSTTSTNNILGAWYQESSFDGGARTGAVLFIIGEKIYISTGYNGNNNNRIFLKDLWEYDSKVDTWKRKADFPGIARYGAAAFSANGKGYVGLGTDGQNYLKDFWSYDPVSDSWTQIKDFAGAARSGAIAFTLNNLGYVGTGNDNFLQYKDFYQYDVNTNTWVQKPSVPKIERTNAFSFVIDGFAYVGGGSNNGSPVQDLYEYDAQGGDGTGAWIQKNDLKDDAFDLDANDKGYNTIARDLAVAFVINGKGYVVAGKFGTSSTLSPETWEYNPATDTWLKKQNFGYNVQGKTQGALNRAGGLGFSLGEFGYVCAGNSGTLYLNDKWKYDPTAINQ